MIDDDKIEAPIGVAGGFVGANNYSPNTADSSIFVRFPFLRHCRAKNLLPLRNQTNLGGLGWWVEDGAASAIEWMR